MSTNKKEVIVILPGLQYIKNGILLIDKIKISATINNKESLLFYLDTSSGNIKECNELTLEIVTNTNQQVKVTSSIYGNLKYLYCNTSDTLLYRALENRFFALWENNLCEISVFNKSLLYQNLSKDLHDGLCFVKLDNVNSNITFKIDFYSNIKYDNDNSNCVLIDTKYYYYNPLLLNVGDVVLDIGTKDFTLLCFYSNDKNKPLDISLQGKHIYKKGDKYSTDTNSEFVSLKPEKDLKLSVWPIPLVNAKYFDMESGKFDNVVHEKSKNVILVDMFGYVCTSNSSILRVNPLRIKCDSNKIALDSTSYYTLIKLKQKWFDTQKNLLGIKANDLHDYGVYNNNFFSSKDSVGLVSEEGNYLYFNKGASKICNIKLDKQLDTNNADNLTFDINIINNAPEKLGDSHDTRRCVVEGDKLGTDYNAYQTNIVDKLLTATGYYIDNNNVFIAYDEHSNNTYYLYKFIDSKNKDFSYLYKESPYVTVKNESKFQPKKVTLKNLSCTIEDINLTNHVSISQKFDLNLSESIVIDFSKHIPDAEYIFPNFIYVIDLDNSKLSLPGISDYKVIPQVPIKTDKNELLGLYENLLVLSNIDTTRNYLGSIATSNSILGCGFLPILVILELSTKGSITFENVYLELGWYVFSFNGYKKVSGHNKELSCTLNIGGNKHSFILGTKTPRAHVLVNIASATTSSIKFELNLFDGIYRFVDITSIGLYKLNLELDSIYTEQLKSLLDDTKDFYIDDENILKNVIFLGVYLYNELGKKCYNKESMLICPPKEAYLKPIGLYTTNPNTTILNNIDNTKFVLFDSDNISTNECDLLISNTILKL